MSEGQTYDMNAIVDGQKVRRGSIFFLIVATLAMVSDGFDISAMGLVAPELVKQWHVAPSDLVTTFSAGIVGMLLGAPLLGVIGDRFGRKTAILLALFAYGTFSIVSMFATSLPQLAAFRFFTGLGLGGMTPNVLALAAEVAPKRLRGMFTIIVLFGVPAGFAISGWVAALLVPNYGWPAIFLIGGLLPIAVGLLGLAFLPESLKFLLQRVDRPDAILRAVRTLRPDLTFDSATKFSAGKAPAIPTTAGSSAGLFAGSLAFITPMLWIAFAANQLTNFFTVSWLPTLLQASGLSTAQAGIYASLFSTGGMVGGVVLTFIIDRFGVLPIVVLFLIGAPLAASMGMAGLTPFAISAIIAGSGFCVTGNNFGLNSAMVLIYPTPVRSMGAGLAQAMGRLGSLAAQFIGGYLLSLHLATQELFLAPASALLIGAASAAVLAILCFKRFKGFRLDELSATESLQLESAAAAARIQLAHSVQSGNDALRTSQ
ncbi:MAG: transporter [Bradyrhizobium sp.]|nr:transporter [Bradyrhizobium sp.]